MLETCKMNYDSTISLRVNLSRVLDELIMDGSDMENIVQFLKSHEENIPDIYRHSAFAYSLYDIMVHPTGIDLFLIEHMGELRTVEFCYAANAIAESIYGNNGRSDMALARLRSLYRGNVNLVEFAKTLSIVPNFQDKFFRLDADIVDWLNRTSDQRDYSRVISHTYLGLSVFQAASFMKLTPSSQFLLLKTIQEKIIEGDFPSHIRNSVRIRNSGKIRAVYGELISTLLRQLLLLNQIEMFNWVLSVLELEGQYGAALIIRLAIENSISSTIPEGLRQMVDLTVIPDLEKKPSFEEVVFEMNLRETSFEPYNLFLYIYLDHDYLLSGMKGNKELIEFFNLPFDWDGMKWLKDDYAVPPREYPF